MTQLLWGIFDGDAFFECRHLKLMREISAHPPHTAIRLIGQLPCNSSLPGGQWMLRPRRDLHKNDAKFAYRTIAQSAHQAADKFTLLKS